MCQTIYLHAQIQSNLATAIHNFASTYWKQTASEEWMPSLVLMTSGYFDIVSECHKREGLLQVTLDYLHYQGLGRETRSINLSMILSFTSQQYGSYSHLRLKCGKAGSVYWSCNWEFECWEGDIQQGLWSDSRVSFFLLLCLADLAGLQGFWMILDMLGAVSPTSIETLEGPVLCLQLVWWHVYIFDSCNCTAYWCILYNSL